MTRHQLPDKAIDQLKLDELLDMWDMLTELERYSIKHLGYKQSPQAMLGKFKRDVADAIASESAKRRLRNS